MCSGGQKSGQKFEAQSGYRDYSTRLDRCHTVWDGSSYSRRIGQREASTSSCNCLARMSRCFVSRGHITDRPAPVVRTESDELLVALEWSSEHAVDDAHADPEVLALWQRKALLADYVAPAAVSGADVPFARWPVLVDL